MTDAALMRRALFHAARAVGATTPNPMVGAVVVSAQGVVVGQGRHPRAGEPHAEVFALEEAGEHARGGTMFVTLEPCCYFGRTAPCTPRVIASGIRRIVIAMEDPNPRVNGRGIAELRAAGLTVDVGLLEREARLLNRPFVSVHTQGRPQVILKAAVSRDGFIAAAAGTRTAISGSAALRRSQRLRAEVDAIAVGAGTLIVDNPLLTVRDRVRSRPLVRAVFDRRLRVAPTAAIFATLDAGPVIILTSGDAMTEQMDRVAALRERGAVVVDAGTTMADAVRALLPFEVSSVLVEGGACVHRALLDERVVDQVNLVVATRLLGAGGVPAFGTGDLRMRGFVPARMEHLGPDTWMEFHVHGHH